MSQDTCTIAFTGDIGFDHYMQGRWLAPDLLSQRILDFFDSADHVVANVEGAMVDAADTGNRGVFFHCMNPEATCLFKKIHADFWNISNNHIMDAGAEGLISTKKIAASMNCRTIGAGINLEEASAPVFLEEAGGIGMFGVAYMTECVPAGATTPGVFRWDDMESIAHRIAEVKRRCRWCIVVAHGGEEFADLPSPYTRNRYLKYLELGADVVVAHHPHVPENYETFHDGKVIFYSLGNFIFDTNYQRVHPYTDQGILLKLYFTQNKICFEAIGTKILRGDERIEACSLPGIFADVQEEEYEKLSPLAAAALVYEEKKKMIYLEPDRFLQATDAKWNEYFFSQEPDGYDKGKHMDFSVIVPLSTLAANGTWRSSKLKTVTNYILNEGERKALLIK